VEIAGSWSIAKIGDAEFAGKRKTTRREAFLAEIDQVVSWKSRCWV
jgi:hypothetical protein